MISIPSTAIKVLTDLLATHDYKDMAQHDSACWWM
jgi:hypothetical protein